MLKLKWFRQLGGLAVILGLLWNPYTALAEEDHEAPETQARTEAPEQEKTTPEATETKPVAERSGRRQEAIDNMKRQLRQINNDGFNAFVSELLATKDLNKDQFNEIVDKLPALDANETRSSEIKEALKQGFEDVIAASGEGADADLSLAARDVLAERLAAGKGDEKLAEKKDELEEEDAEKKLEETLEKLLADKNKQEGEEDPESKAEEALKSLLDDANSRFDDILNAANEAAAEEEEEEDPLAGLGEDIGSDSGAGSGDSGAGSGDSGSGGGDSGAGESPSSEPPSNSDLGKNNNNDADKNNSKNLGNIAKASQSNDANESNSSDESNDFSLDSSDPAEEPKKEEPKPESTADSAISPDSEVLDPAAGFADSAPPQTSELSPVANPASGGGALTSFADLGGGAGGGAPTVNAGSGLPLSNGDGDPFSSVGASYDSTPPRGAFNYIRTGAKDFGSASGSLDSYGEPGGDEGGYGGRRKPPSAQTVSLNPSQGGRGTWEGAGPGIFSERHLKKVCDSAVAGSVGVCSRKIQRSPASEEFERGMRTQSIFRKALGG